MSKEQLEEKIAELGIQVRGWNDDTTHPEKERILNDILQELKFFECKLALIDPVFMAEYPLNNDQCLEYIYDFDAMKKEKVGNMADLETKKLEIQNSELEAYNKKLEENKKFINKILE